MKEIKDFVNMMGRREKFLSSASASINESLDSKIEWTLKHRSLQVTLQSKEYQVLKALVDKPISKIKVTDEIIEVAKKAYIQNSRDEFGYIHEAIKAALEAVFNHIGCQESHISPKRPLEENQGEWIEWFGGDSPLKKGQLAEVRLSNGTTQVYESYLDIYFWEHREKHDLGHNVIAYRVISEPKEERVDCPNCHVGNSKNQALLEYAVNRTRNRLGELSTDGIIELISDFLEQNK